MHGTQTQPGPSLHNVVDRMHIPCPPPPPNSITHRPGPLLMQGFIYMYVCLYSGRTSSSINVSFWSYHSTDCTNPCYRRTVSFNYIAGCWWHGHIRVGNMIWSDLIWVVFTSATSTYFRPYLVPPQKFTFYLIECLTHAWIIKYKLKK